MGAKLIKGGFRVLCGRSFKFKKHQKIGLSNFVPYMVNGGVANRGPRRFGGLANFLRKQDVDMNGISVEDF